MIKREKAEYTALDLLRQYLELCGFTPDQSEWNTEALRENPPRLIRLQRLKALFHAFGIPFDRSQFEKGKFIDWKNPVYEVFRDRARAWFVRERAEGRSPVEPDVEARPFVLEFVFERLLEYRVALDQSLSFNRGCLAASGLYYFQLKKIEELNRVIHDHLAIIEDLLVELISPTGRTISFEQLVKEHGYPDVDLFEIDVRWF